MADVLPVSDAALGAPAANPGGLDGGDALQERRRATRPVPRTAGDPPDTGSAARAYRRNDDGAVTHKRLLCLRASRVKCIALRKERLERDFTFRPATPEQYIARPDQWPRSSIPPPTRSPRRVFSARCSLLERWRGWDRRWIDRRMSPRPASRAISRCRSATSITSAGWGSTAVTVTRRSRNRRSPEFRRPKPA